MSSTHIGELVALATAFCWTATAFFFEYGVKRIGTLSLNLIRLSMAFVFLCLYSLAFRGMLLPFDATPETWFWLILSGLVGFVLGDIFLFRSYIDIGARIANTIYASVPPMTALVGFFLLGETLGVQEMAGMAITLGGLALVLTKKGEKSGTLQFSHPVRGVLYAFLGAVGQAGGLVLSKYGAPSYNAFSATQIRCIAGLVGFAAINLAMRRAGKVASAFRERKAIGMIFLGAFFGPFLGVSFGLYAIQHTATGIASTIMALVPVIIIAPSYFIFREKVTLREIIGAVVAVAGTVVLFLR